MSSLQLFFIIIFKSLCICLLYLFVPLLFFDNENGLVIMLHSCIQNIHEKEQQRKEQQVKIKRYKCLKCPREYRSKNHLERHTLAHLTPKKPRMYTCTLCSTKFTTRSHRYVQGKQGIFLLRCFKD